MKYSLFNILWIASNLRRYVSFLNSRKNVRKVQENILLKNIIANKNTSYGVEYNFSAIRSIDEFKKNVPIISYENIKDDIREIALGKRNILTKDKVKILEPTSGSTTASKLIPYTQTLQKEFNHAIGAWIFDMFKNNPSIISGQHYWSISPFMHNDFPDEYEIPIGFESDEEYLGKISKLLVKKLFVIPNVVKQIENIDNFQYITLLFLLYSTNMTFISIWSPTYLNILLEQIPKWEKQLVNDIKHGTINTPKPLEIKIKKQLTSLISPNKERAYQISELLKKAGSQHKECLEDIWPKLSLISCWGDGNSKQYINAIKKIFPNVPIQEKGLIATEAFVSFPMGHKKGKNLAITSHFFEFIEYTEGERKHSDTILAHELEVGKQYVVVVTTGGGLYRYNLQDIIEVVGFDNQCPLLKFIGKTNNISDMVGEKLNENQVTTILDMTLDKYNLKPLFVMLAPGVRNKRTFYTLFLEIDNYQKIKDDLIQLEILIEKLLRNNFHYDLCRKLNQLDSLNIYIIDSKTKKANEIYMETNMSRGLSMGNIKNTSLSSFKDWTSYFPGNFLKNH